MGDDPLLVAGVRLVLDAMQRDDDEVGAARASRGDVGEGLAEEVAPADVGDGTPRTVGHMAVVVDGVGEEAKPDAAPLDDRRAPSSGVAPAPTTSRPAASSACRVRGAPCAPRLLTWLFAGQRHDVDCRALEQGGALGVAAERPVVDDKRLHRRRQERRSRLAKAESAWRRSGATSAKGIAAGVERRGR